MSNGNMKVHDGKYSGDIRTRSIHLNFWLEKSLSMPSHKSPTHTIWAKSPLGHSYQAGVAWERTIQRGDSTGQSMVSLVLDDPDFGDKPISFSAFPSKDGLEIKLERTRIEAVETAAAA